MIHRNNSGGTTTAGAGVSSLGSTATFGGSGSSSSSHNVHETLQKENEQLHAKLKAMHETVDTYKLEVAGLQEQLRAFHFKSQQQQQQRQRQRQHVSFSRGGNSHRPHPHPSPTAASTDATTTEQQLQNIMSELLALTHRYMLERDAYQFNNNKNATKF